jgi:small redox-active disulfide protein 2
METTPRKIEVLGPGCARCKETFLVVAHVVETGKLPFTVEKVEGMDRMIELGLLATPGVAVEGKVLFSGRIPKADEIRTALAAL